MRGKPEARHLMPGSHPYKSIETAGIGTFGTVFKAKRDDGKIVAIKKVFFDPKFKNREFL